ncbi:hypothetical protein HOG48_06090 [Candidatus Peregrinibacteria bacterium]|nr:hypothetical protein [Candidatus Peregrinibacteria bacterium]
MVGHALGSSDRKRDPVVSFLKIDALMREQSETGIDLVSSGEVFDDVLCMIESGQQVSREEVFEAIEGLDELFDTTTSLWHTLYEDFGAASIPREAPTLPSLVGSHGEGEISLPNASQLCGMMSEGATLSIDNCRELLRRLGWITTEPEVGETTVKVNVRKLLKLEDGILRLREALISDLGARVDDGMLCTIPENKGSSVLRGTATDTGFNYNYVVPGREL